MLFTPTRALDGDGPTWVLANGITDSIRQQAAFDRR